MNDQIKRVRVKFLDSIAGLKDPTQVSLDTKYRRMAESMEAEKNGKLRVYNDSQIAAAVDAERKRDQAVIRTGFAKDWAYKPDQEASVNVEIAEHWEAAGICSIITEPNKKAA